MVVSFFAAAALWDFESPSYAMMEMRDAAAAGDADALYDSIDLPTVRKNLTADLRAELVRNAAIDKIQGPETQILMKTMEAVDGLVYRFVTAERIQIIINTGNFEQPGAEYQKSTKNQTDWSIKRDELNRFTATPDAPDRSKVPSLMFERDGLGWKVTRIILPADRPN
ncbi:MAG: DUF2939 domain-containing protein [Novosphingobium sp.]|nr:DUF2939 domain-containing protein [Novosphingobium sp.]